MVNESEMQFYQNCANQKNGGAKRPVVRNLALGGTKPALDGSCRAKSTKKQRFFMKRTPTRIAWRQLFTVRWFLTKTQKLDCFIMSRLAALKACQSVSGKFLETYHSLENHAYNTFMLVIQFIIMNLKSRNVMNSYPNLDSLLKI